MSEIYEIVNSINAQTMGDTAIAVTDTASLVAMGDAVLSSSENTECWLNTLVQRIGRTIMSYRAYTNPLSLLAVDDMRYGAIMQKIKIEMPNAVEDISVNLSDGDSVDMYVVSKPRAKQKLFVKRTPFVLKVTEQTKWLREAFESETDMGAFIVAMYGEIRNKIELSQENLARLTMGNFIANMDNAQIIPLRSNYNTLTGQSLTADTCLLDNGFLRYAIGQMQLYSMKMTTMNTLYNKEGEQRHTPYELQNFITLADFETAMRTQVEYSAFHETAVSKGANIVVPYWQSADDPSGLSLQIGGDEEAPITKEMSNIIGIISDRDAFGTYRVEETVATTPLNALGLYFNTFYHINNLYFNDMSEQAVVFTLN